MGALLEVDELRVRFRVKGPLRALVDRDRDPYIDAVYDVSLALAGGETLALVGESGSGKTTLARAIAGLVPVQGGRIRYAGHDLRGLGERALRAYRRDIAMMFQDPVGSLSPRLPVRSLLAEPFRIHAMTTGRDLDAEVSRLLQMVGLAGHIAGHYPHQLSGGQARRVGVARALALNPKLIIADEPTAGLDVSVQGEVLNLLARLQAELGIGMLIITHNLNIVRHIADRMAIMYLGRFVEQGPTDTLFARSRHPYTRALLSASPEPDPDARLNRIELRGEVPSLMNRPAGCEFHSRCPFVGDDCHRVVPEPVSEDDSHSYRCRYPLSPDPSATPSRRR